MSKVFRKNFQNHLYQVHLSLLVFIPLFCQKIIYIIKKKRYVGMWKRPYNHSFPHFHILKYLFYIHYYSHFFSLNFSHFLFFIHQNIFNLIGTIFHDAVQHQTAIITSCFFTLIGKFNHPVAQSSNIFF